MAATTRYADPQLGCDIVMKGGITSGVVYPGAVLSLAEKYRFRSIGGASAGGIAAAVVAAAEYARSDGGFEKLAKLPNELAGTSASGKPLMLQLFQADKETRPLFNVLIGGLEGKKRGALIALLKSFPLFPIVALAVAVIGIVLSVFAGVDAAYAVGGVFAAAVILIVGLALQIARVVGKLPDNDFGLCRLGPGVGSTKEPALTGWLHARIQATAGRSGDDSPLTFAELYAGPDAQPPTDLAERTEWLKSLESDKRVIDLQMMTTDLTRGLPMRLPAQYDPHTGRLGAAGGLFFDPAELGKFFPPKVVELLETNAPAPSERTAARLSELGATHLKLFPAGPDLPVVVATRMTLSFPVLISAIPLYRIDFRGPDAPALVRVVFSDGGITSNFPVHFFDSPLPRRPTFALNLIGFDPWEQPDPIRPCDAVHPPNPVNQAAPVRLTYIETLGGFFTAIKDAMQNWRDNAQAELPGYRDRVAAVKMGPGEGGLNLTMKSDKITELNARGKCAGDALVERFTPSESGEPPEFWNDHRFVRYRMTMATLESYLKKYDRGYSAPADAATQTYPDRVAAGTEAPYPLTPDARRDFALARSAEYVALAAATETLDDADVPRPPATLRAVPPT